VAGEDRPLALRQALELGQVDRELRRQGRLTHAFHLFRQQLVDGHAVEGGDLVQTGDRDIPVAALIGSQQ